MEPQILYEDENIIAINKPAGLIVHGDGKRQEPTLVDWLLQKYPEIKDVGESWQNQKEEVILRSGIVHRLDRETSGVMLVAKTQKGFDTLKEQFQNHTIKKIYHAFVFGEIKEDNGIIERPIGRSNKDFRMWSAQRGARGELREAITEYTVENRGKGYSFVHVMPKTGRTHQIRVHFKAISHPLVGDSLYTSGRENELGFTRLALHSYEVTFMDTNEVSHTITAPEPEDFTEARVLLQKR